jgi:hypothetical protein
MPVFAGFFASGAPGAISGFASVAGMHTLFFGRSNAPVKAGAMPEGSVLRWRQFQLA